MSCEKKRMAALMKKKLGTAMNGNSLCRMVHILGQGLPGKFHEQRSDRGEGQSVDTICSGAFWRLKTRGKQWFCSGQLSL